MMDNEEDQHAEEDHGDQFASEEELRHESESEPLAGCDVDHCQRMHE